MKILTKVLALFLLVAAASYTSPAQEKSIAIGIGAGLSRGVNESRPTDRNIGPLFGIYGLYNNGIINGLTPELSVSYMTNGTKNDGSGYDGTTETHKTDFNGYKSTLINIDLKLRYDLFHIGWFTPYVMAGVGANIFSVNDTSFFHDNETKEFDGTAYPENAKLDTDGGVTLGIPVGLGFTYDFHNKLALDFNVGINMSLTDKLNAIKDGIDDANWFARLGVSYKVKTFAKDSDGDGLSDEDELRLGTDPNNPDTDGDGLKDGEEVKKYKTDPLDPDTDGGGIKDGVEVRNGADPLDADDDILNISVGEKLVLRNIEFVTGKSDITPKSEKILNNALRAMQKMPDMKFEIVGHTDDVGDDDANMKLSQDRAAAVKQWLVSRGIDGGRLSTRGAGETEPMVPNTNDTNRQRNRRVVFYRTK